MKNLFIQPDKPKKYFDGVVGIYVEDQKTFLDQKNRYIIYDETVMHTTQYKPDPEYLLWRCYLVSYNDDVDTRFIILVKDEGEMEK